MTSSIPLPWTNIALMRGRGWQAADLAGHLIIRCDVEDDPTPIQNADVLTINLREQQAIFNLANGEKRYYRLEQNDDWHLIPRVEMLAGLPRMVVPRVTGILEAKTIESMMERDFKNTTVLLPGTCHWSERKWCASPTGFRTSTGTWSHFLTTGGRGGFSLPMGAIANTDGIAIDAMSARVIETQWMQSLTDALSNSYFIKNEPHGASCFLILAQSLQEAVLLVLIRKAIGIRGLEVQFKNEPAPPWKRFAQHLNGQIHANRVETLTLQSIENILNGVDFDSLVRQINRHSQVIPESILNP